MDLFNTMARRYSGAFIKKLSGFVFEQREPVVPPCPVFRVHGQRDAIISRPRFADLMVDGGHIISLTNDSQVNDFITRCIASI